MTEEIRPESPESTASGETDASVAQAIQEGADDAKSAASRVWPAAGKYIAKGIYGTCYAASYGVVFTALTVGKLLPTDSAAMHGVQDGAQDARKTVEGGEVRKLDIEPAAS